jgi:DNA-binding transcriptional ArsR family regulator
VKELTERLDLSQATIYRRIETLEKHGLVEERTLVADDGNHFSVYWSEFDGLLVTLNDDGYDVRVLQEGDLPDGPSDTGESLSSR